MLTIGGSIVHPTTAPPTRCLSEVWKPKAFGQLERRAQAVHKYGVAITTQHVHLGREALGQGDSMWGLLALQTKEDHHMPPDTIEARVCTSGSLPEWIVLVWALDHSPRVSSARPI